jgi:hypothetical protein
VADLQASLSSIARIQWATIHRIGSAACYVHRWQEILTSCLMVHARLIVETSFGFDVCGADPPQDSYLVTLDTKSGR